MQRCREFYGAEVTNLDFDDPQAPDIINAWVNNQTHGKISDYCRAAHPPLDHSLPDQRGSTSRGGGRSQFVIAATRQGVFHLLDGREKRCPLMTQSGRVSVPRRPELPGDQPALRRRPLQSVCLLARGRTGSGRLSQIAWTAEAWGSGPNGWTQFGEQDGAISLPGSRLAYGRASMMPCRPWVCGLPSAPRPTSRRCVLTSSLGLSTSPIVRHKTFMEVNEEGTVAAAVTKVEMRMRGLPPPSFRMVVDRPFFCAIRDNETGVIVFAGVVVEPE